MTEHQDMQNHNGAHAMARRPQSIEHDLKGLAREIEALHAMQHALATSGALEQLLRIIPRPGWTTPAEFALVRGQIAHMTLLVQGLERAQTGLLRGADMVGTR